MDEIKYFFKKHKEILIILIIIIFLAIIFGISYIFDSGNSWSCNQFGNKMIGCK